MMRINLLLRPALSTLLLGLALVPRPAHAYQVFFGYGYGVPYRYPYYYRPPVVAVPPPGYHPPSPLYADPANASGPLSTRCDAGAAICLMPAPAPVGSACSCHTTARNYREPGRVSVP